ncbi:hypothetical protein [uncultured Zhongshania sp.]|jgi:hypothetical protein|uniref:hypothetical protein n=1 Tax=uncultured Zhongshania sp. TaxID=1642288 RepID=UPI0025F6D25E|nr:hypothetical protein [uncultured Zhongshania sp.]
MNSPPSNALASLIPPNINSTTPEVITASGFDFSGFIWIAWIIAILAWLATYYTNKRLQKRLELFRLMDKFNEQLQRAEDIALDYWMRNTVGVDLIHITIALKRLTNLAVKIEKLDNDCKIPQREIVRFRRAVTLTAKPMPQTGVREIMLSSSELQQYYEKSF